MPSAPAILDYLSSPLSAGTRWARWWAILSSALVVLAGSVPAGAVTLAVGPGKPFSTVAGAVAAAHDGDVVEVQAGTYTNDFATITRRISIVGVGGLARLVATIPIPNGKGIFVMRSANATLERLEFNGARVADRNGAGIRYEAGILTIKRCYFKNNENGILAAANATGKIAITSSEFDGNGRGDGYTHGLYVNKIAELRIVGSYFHDTKVGHHIKSRAASTIIDGNRIVDGTVGTASYNVDAPNGGAVVITNNNIVQSAASQNATLIHFGGESAPYAGSSLGVSSNIMQNFRSSAIGVLNATTRVRARCPTTWSWARQCQFPRPLPGGNRSRADNGLSRTPRVTSTAPATQQP